MNTPHAMPDNELAQTETEARTTLVVRNIHTTEALARFAGDEARYRHWLIEFIAHGPGAAMQIREAIGSGAHETAIRLTHALKGRTGMLGMAELHSIAQTLEMALKNNEPSSFWLDELERTAEEMSKDISVALGKNPA